MKKISMPVEDLGKDYGRKLEKKNSEVTPKTYHYTEELTE
jgi:hypothetical protein